MNLCVKTNFVANWKYALRININFFISHASDFIGHYFNSIKP